MGDLLTYEEELPDADEESELVLLEEAPGEPGAGEGEADVGAGSGGTGGEAEGTGGEAEGMVEAEAEAEAEDTEAPQ